MIHRNLLLPCNDLPFEARPGDTRKRSKRKLPTAQPHLSSPGASNVGDSSEEESAGMLTFTPVEPESALSDSTCSTKEPSANQACADEEAASSIYQPDLQIQAPTDPVLEPSVVEKSEVRPGEGRPIRERRPPTLLTYDSFGTPSYYQPAGLCLISHNAGAAAIPVPLAPGPLGGIPNVCMNSVWPVTYPTSYGYVGSYPF